MTPACFELRLTRGEDYRETWALVDDATGAPLISPSTVLVLTVRSAAGASSSYFQATQGSAGVALGIINLNYVSGEFDVIIPAASVALIPGSAMDVTECSWSLHLTTPDTLTQTYGLGPCRVYPAT